MQFLEIFQPYIHATNLPFHLLPKVLCWSWSGDCACHWNTLNSLWCSRNRLEMTFIHTITSTAACMIDTRQDGSMDLCCLRRDHLHVAAQIKICRTRLCFSNLLSSGIGIHVLTVSSSSWSSMTGVEPGLIFCCCSPSSSRLSKLCIQRRHSPLTSLITRCSLPQIVLLHHSLWTPEIVMQVVLRCCLAPKIRLRAKSLRSPVFSILFGLTTTKLLHNVCMFYLLTCSNIISYLEEQAICINEQVSLIKWPLSVYATCPGSDYKICCCFTTFFLWYSTFLCYNCNVVWLPSDYKRLAFTFIYMDLF